MKMRHRKKRAYAKRGFGWGKRCPDYMPGCIICEAWAFYDKNKRWPSFDEARAAVLVAEQLEGAKP